MLKTASVPQVSSDLGSLAIANNLSDLANVATARINLGLVIGTNVQAYNANLTTFAGIAPSANVQSILGAADYAAVKTLLALTIGTNVQAYNANLTTFAGIAPSANVQTLLGAASFAAFKTSLSLENVTNTSDADKPVSTAQQTALDLKANLSGATFTGAVIVNRGTLLSDNNIFSVSATYNSAPTTFTGAYIDVTNTASAGNSNAFKISVSGSDLFSYRVNGEFVNAGIITVLGGGTVTDPSAPLTLSQTWNDAADTMLGLVVSITDTASAAASKLISCSVGGVSKWAVDKSGYPYSQSEKMFDRVDANTLSFWPGNSYGSACYFRPNLGSGAMSLQLSNGIAFGTNTPASVDAGIGRNAAGVIEFNNGTLGTLRDYKGRRGSMTEYLDVAEMTAPAAPAANTGRLFVEDNGSGKTRLVVIFPTGAAQVIATEP